MKRHILIATAVAALLPAGLALAQSTTPSTPSQPSNSPQGNTSPNSTRGSSPAHNQTPDKSQGHSATSTGGTFTSMDSNGDGRISRTEAAMDDTLGRGFAQADRNGDGYLDQGEYSSRSRANQDTSDSPSTTSDEGSTNNPSPSNAPASDPPRQ